MPYATLDASGGSVLVFSCDRAVFEDCQFSTGMLQNRVPYVNVTGDCSLALDTHRVLDHTDRLVRPGKGVIAGAIRTFVEGGR